MDGWMDACMHACMDGWREGGREGGRAGRMDGCNSQQCRMYVIRNSAADELNSCL